jgi:hypothetical protein
MCLAPKMPKMPPSAPPTPEAPKPYIPELSKDPAADSMRKAAGRLGTNQLVIPLNPINPL